MKAPLTIEYSKMAIKNVTYIQWGEKVFALLLFFVCLFHLNHIRER